MPVDDPGYRLSPLARADLEEIWIHTFRTRSPMQANLYHGRMIPVIEVLAIGRRSGRPSDIRRGYFKHAAGSRVIFHRTSATFDMIRILHRRMDASRHL